MVVAALAALVVWLATRGGSSQPSADPVVFLRGIVTRIASNDYASVWPKLHPAQQRVVPQGEYVRCEELTPIPGRLDWIRLVKSADERITVPGDDGVVDSKAVTFRLKLTSVAVGSSVVVTQTVHAVAVGGEWRWILTAKRFASYRAKTCPSLDTSPQPTA